MHAYIKKGTGKITIDYRDLAQEMYFKDENIEISHYGNNEMLWGEYSNFSVNLDKWLVDKRWKKIDGPVSITQPQSNINRISNTDIIFAWTDNVEVTTMDQRAHYRTNYRIIQELAGMISEDEKVSWMTPEAYYDLHKEIIEMSFEAANAISLKEVLTIELNEELGNYR